MDYQLNSDLAEQNFSSEDEPQEIWALDVIQTSSGVEVKDSMFQKSFENYNEIVTDLQQESIEVRKSFEGSNQSQEELGHTNSGLFFKQDQIVTPPYNPNCFAEFLDTSEIHYACVSQKVRDSVERPYTLEPRVPIRSVDASEEDEDQHGDSISQEQFQEECRKVQAFINNVDDCEDFEEINRKVGMDHEGIGWAGYEVQRNAVSGVITRLKRIPAARLRVLKGFKGFAEIVGKGQDGKDQYSFYQTFGEKIKYREVIEVDGVERDFLRNYDPNTDGPLRLSPEVVDGEVLPPNPNLVWNIVDEKTGKKLDPTFENITQKAAQEVLYLPKSHNNNIYYGFSDAVSAISAMVTNAFIENNNIEFLSNDCVPRYVIMVEGGKPDDSFKKSLKDYFENNSQQKSLLTFIPSIGGRQPKITFHPIQTTAQEADFMETRRANNQLIMVSHRMPPAMIAIQESASLGSGRGRSQAENYVNRIVFPLQNYWSRKINKLFSIGLGCPNVVIKFDELDVRDRFQDSQVQNIKLTNGTLTINEARREDGLPPLKGGDIAFIKTRTQGLIKVSDLPEMLSQGLLTDNSDSIPNELDFQDSKENLQIREEVSQIQEILRELIDNIAQIQSVKSVKQEEPDDLAKKVKKLMDEQSGQQDV